MIQTVEAVYDGAVLRPETALGLEPNTRVRLTVEVLPTAHPAASTDHPLRGMVLRYDEPTTPVAEADWDALK
jgi:hypothetical protein